MPERIPPEPLDPGPVPEAGPIVMATDPDTGLPYPEEPCDCESGNPAIVGILWEPDRPAPPGEPGVQVVERCESCERYESDEAAARVVAAKYNLTAVFLEDRDWDAGLEEEDLGRGFGMFGVLNPAAVPSPPPPPRPACDHVVDTTRLGAVIPFRGRLVFPVRCLKCLEPGHVAVDTSEVRWALGPKHDGGSHEPEGGPA